MGTYFTDITNGQQGNAATFNGPLTEFDDLFADLLDGTQAFDVVEIDRIGDGANALLRFSTDDGQESRIEIETELGLQWRLSSGFKNNLTLERFADGVKQTSAIQLFGENSNFYINSTYNAHPDFFAPLTNGGANLGTPGSRFANIYLQNSPDVSSDERLKTGIADIDTASAAAFIRAVVPIIYQRESGGVWSAGWGASRIKDNLGLLNLEPNGVTMYKTSGGEAGYASIAPDEITAVLHAAMRDMMSTIEALKAQVMELEKIVKGET